jgi:hypothetical protein
MCLARLKLTDVLLLDTEGQTSLSYCLCSQKLHSLLAPIKMDVQGSSSGAGAVSSVVHAQYV